MDSTKVYLHNESVKINMGNTTNNFFSFIHVGGFTLSQLHVEVAPYRSLRLKFWEDETFRASSYPVYE